MRRKLSLLRAVLLLLSLLSGCDKEEETIETESRPTVATAPAEEETEAPEEETAETEATEETAEETEASPLRTAVIRSGDDELQADFMI